MELRHLRYFVALAEELHFGHAAARLGISQPPLSQQIKILEDMLRVRLFNRTNRRVELTQTGLLFLAEARATLERAERAISVATRAQRGELGELRIGMFPSAPLLTRIGDAILTFRRNFPDVQLVLNEIESHQQTQGLLEGREQVAIIRSAAAPVLPSELQATELIREPFRVMMRSDHRLAKRRMIPIGELAQNLSSSTATAWDEPCRTRFSPYAAPQDSTRASVNLQTATRPLRDWLPPDSGSRLFLRLCANCTTNPSSATLSIP